MYVLAAPGAFQHLGTQRANGEVLLDCMYASRGGSVFTLRSQVPLTILPDREADLFILHKRLA